jgi:hypothetical protein
VSLSKLGEKKWAQNLVLGAGLLFGGCTTAAKFDLNPSKLAQNQNKTCAGILANDAEIEINGFSDFSILGFEFGGVSEEIKNYILWEIKNLKFWIRNEFKNLEIENNVFSDSEENKKIDAQIAELKKQKENENNRLKKYELEKQIWELNEKKECQMDLTIFFDEFSKKFSEVKFPNEKLASSVAEEIELAEAAKLVDFLAEIYQNQITQIILNLKSAGNSGQIQKASSCPNSLKYDAIDYFYKISAKIRTAAGEIFSANSDETWEMNAENYESPSKELNEFKKN